MGVNCCHFITKEGSGGGGGGGSGGRFGSLGIPSASCAPVTMMMCCFGGPNRNRQIDRGAVGDHFDGVNVGVSGTPFPDPRWGMAWVVLRRPHQRHHRASQIVQKSDLTHKLSPPFLSKSLFWTNANGKNRVWPFGACFPDPPPLLLQCTPARHPPKLQWTAGPVRINGGTMFSKNFPRGLNYEPSPVLRLHPPTPRAPPPPPPPLKRLGQIFFQKNFPWCRRRQFASTKSLVRRLWRLSHWGGGGGTAP